jgi:hypothetical protein
VLYCSPPTASPRVHEAMRAGLLAYTATPGQGNVILPGVTVIKDNGCGPGKNGKPGKGWPGDERFDAWLRRDADDAELMSRTLFAVAPDVVGDAEATLARFRHWGPRIRAYGYRVAFVAQNGLDRHLPPWGAFDVGFIGGDDAFKLGPIAERFANDCHAAGVPVHMGRVNGGRRALIAGAVFGCRTSDGTLLVNGPDKHLDYVLSWRGYRGQGDLFALLDGEATA